MGKTRSLHSVLRLSGHSRWWAGVCVTGVLTTELGAGGLGRLTAALDPGPSQGHAAASAATGRSAPAHQVVLRGGRGCAAGTAGRARRAVRRHHRVRLHRQTRLVVDVCVTGLSDTAHHASAVSPAAVLAPVVRAGAGHGTGRRPVARRDRQAGRARAPRPHVARAALAGSPGQQALRQQQQGGSGQAHVLLVARPDPTTSTSPVALVGRVRPTSLSLSPTGRVCFHDGGSLTTLGCSTLIPQANGVMRARIQVVLGRGTHSIVATYAGDAHFTAAQSSTLVLVVG